MLVQQGSAGRFAVGEKKAGDRLFAMVFCGGAFNLGLFMLNFWQALTTHPMTPWFGWLGLGTILIFAALGQVRPYIPEDPIEKLQKTLGAANLPYSLFLILLLFWATIALLLFTGLLSVIWQVIAAMLPAAPDTAEGKAAQWEYRLLLTKLAALTTVLGATVALPFTIIRVKLANEQNRHAEEVLYNEKIHEAINGLHAQRQVTIRNPKTMDDPWTTQGPRASEKLIDVWEDDLIRRSGAIAQLEALAIERPEQSHRIARILWIYLISLVQSIQGLSFPRNMTPSRIAEWGQQNGADRPDIPAASQVLDRMMDRTGIPAKSLGIDLSDLSLEDVELNEEDFEHVSAIGVNLENANLTRTNLQSANLRNAILRGAKIHGTIFNKNTILTGVKTNGASFRNVDLSVLMNVDELIEHAFGDRSVILPDSVPFPDTRWPDTELDDETYQEEYRRFLSDPDAYIPPQHRND
ncbi:pentapeptide repeat-containing protein [Aliiroseovarius crassostreae]|uniref:Pentapeptide repeat-containing protein n=1 Tax=Aliiroseovarius crassostreae TaxID=154981 RepID=A0A9Q9HCW7_9RHOB|nr:pentapeptide repeat-containing protein [Aliiroseovarius crassostreae]UWP94480.1 pentapeptide repeat-containing protein [Aliiroseovarius crassostreae]